VLFQRADARYAEKIFQFIEKTGLIAAGKSDCGGSHGNFLSLAQPWAAINECENVSVYSAAECIC
jgi:hypothetical protein